MGLQDAALAELASISSDRMAAVRSAAGSDEGAMESTAGAGSPSDADGQQPAALVSSDLGGGVFDSAPSLPGERLTSLFHDSAWRGLREEGSYREGVRHGLWRAFRPDGTLRHVGSYDQGLRDGLWESYAATGVLETELSYEAGLRQGDWRAYGESGSVLEEGQYENNHASGRWTSYYTGGQIKERGLYVNGLREGHWEFYDDLGEPTLQAGEYRAGVKIQ